MSRRASALVLIALLFAVGACRSDATFSPSASARALANSAPTVAPIQAVFSPNLKETRYTSAWSVVNRYVNLDDEVTYRWFGPDCGDWSNGLASYSVHKINNNGFPAVDSSMIWSHPHPPCSADTSHADTLVTFSVTWNWGGGGSIICVYPGADSGTGPACKLP